MGGFWKDGTWAAYAAFVVFGLIGFLLWFTYHWDFWDLCVPNADQTSAGCFRQWFGAAAGYLAVIVAIFTVYPLYRQIDEQKKQTEFLIGDSSPTIDVIVHQENSEELVVRIVNWNRRALMIRSLEVLGDVIDVRCWSVEKHKNGDPLDAHRPEWRSGHKPDFRPPIALAGWEDRQQRPSWAQIKLLNQNAKGTETLKWPAKLSVEATVQILGEKHQVKPLVGYLTPQI